MNYVLLILGMAVITWLIRAAVFVLGEPHRVSAACAHGARLRARHRDDAIIVPMTVSPHGTDAELTWRNPQLVGALAAVAVSALTRRPLLTIAVGLAVFFLWQGVVLK
ncbi:branched-chain amino acid transporter [Paraburkholderia steynii]|uniref:Branched-chain amino acid transporter n=1 Tax=Paraburkholderia steynii TaxID=1245441 RepID=A0A4R0XAM3_9BURK|nr:branched-chain amino acid transporter [Paraburkholderia steynii]